MYICIHPFTAFCIPCKEEKWLQVQTQKKKKVLQFTFNKTNSNLFKTLIYGTPNTR